MKNEGGSFSYGPAAPPQNPMRRVSAPVPMGICTLDGRKVPGLRISLYNDWPQEVLHMVHSTVRAIQSSWFRQRAPWRYVIIGLVVALSVALAGGCGDSDPTENWPDDWSSLEDDVLDELNDLRSGTVNCGTGDLGPVPALQSQGMASPRR